MSLNRKTKIMNTKIFLKALDGENVNLSQFGSAISFLESANELLNSDEINKETWFNFLDKTRTPDFLSALETVENRNNWAETVFAIMQKTDYNFLDMLIQRVEKHPDKVLFRDMSEENISAWTYKQVFQHLKEIAAFFYFHQPEKPRVAIYLNNSIEGASVDLACLAFDIFNTPLNIHFSADILAYIFETLDINYVITDTMERLKVVTQAVEMSGKEVKIVVTAPELEKSAKTDFYLGKECKTFSIKEADLILSKRKRKRNNQVATTMFTSGSTGMPKGVSFSIYNIVSKRFARAAALPKVGKKEIFLCFLPLFHTFGRYLELTGSIYWSATYTFAGNASSATLLKLFPELNPSIFISVPIRWVQLYDECIKKTENLDSETKKHDAVKNIIGKNLHWGLSAAGYLDPKIFRFFQNYGVELCSGFGMTEATGGITMTPPGNYIENSTGIALPGIVTRLGDENELELKGHYLAKYLEDAQPDQVIPYPHEEDYWLKTGDVFKIRNDGHHEIIDRVKDIYKNDKGQTVAPGMIEKRFSGVPGIKSTFVVGDAKPYNVLLIVPDLNETILKSMGSEENRNEYFHQIVSSANKELAPYERVINFTVLDRDFSEEQGELTAKGSFKRKVIEQNYEELVKKLYKRNHIYFQMGEVQISVPRWFYRDIGILENDIILNDNGLYNIRTKQTLRIQKYADTDKFRIGDLVYRMKTNTIDIGRLVRQPRLWVANPELIAFSPCKESFDLPLKDFYSEICIPNDRKVYTPEQIPFVKSVNDSDLIFLNNLLSMALHSEPKIALKNLSEIETVFPDYDRNNAEVIRRRIESLSCHSDENLRIMAYRILISKDPDSDLTSVFPAFIKSGKTFLNEESIMIIAKTNIGKRHLDSLRKRMYAYRNELEWPATENMRSQFDNIFRLLYNFGLNYPKYYGSIRAEFASWRLMDNEPVLAKLAEEYFFKLYTRFQKYIDKKTEILTDETWEDIILFDDGITEEVIQIVKEKLKVDNFLAQSIFLAFDDLNFKLSDIPPKGIWVSRVRSYSKSMYFRLSINTTKGKHFDLLMSINKAITETEGLKTIQRYLSIAGHPFGTPVLTQFGCYNPRIGISSARYVSEVSAWEKIRSLAQIQLSVGVIDLPNVWRKLFIKGMSAFYKAWHNSRRRILPGFVSPNNVVVPETDFSDSSIVISLSGWKRVDSVYPLIIAMYHNFYNKTIAHYPNLYKHLNISWIFHAMIEAFGKNESTKLLKSFREELSKNVNVMHYQALVLALDNYLEGLSKRYYLPIALFNAIDRYTDWIRKNPLADVVAKEQTIAELFELYRLNQYPEIVRYRFYRETYFKNAENESAEAFDTLLRIMSEDSNIKPIQLIELSDLQESLTKETDKLIFSKMVFPKMPDQQRVTILKIGEEKEKHVVVSSVLKDKNNVEYTMREPLTPSETGSIYKLFYKENYPKEISKMDKHFLVMDSDSNIIAGLCYKILENDIVLLDGTVVTAPLHGRGVGSGMIEDFFIRMRSQRVKIIKAHFLFGNYYLKHNFKVDKKWGALVKVL